MKGTFFSADFLRDENDNLRLIEVNTDTGIVANQKSVFDWTDFIDILETNSITEVEVLYKHSIQAPIVETLSASLSENAPFVTTYVETLIDENNIFPQTPTDGDSKFILRMVYDELAILDSEYAKGTLGLMKLFLDSGDSGSIINFYHSSSVYGEYDTIDRNLSNPSNVPDVISKTVVEEHLAHNFYKIGNSESASADRVNAFISTIGNINLILEQYHYSPTAVAENEGKITSIRSFQIVYGSNLDLCYVAEYEIPAVFELPTDISNEINDTEIDNKLSRKHYYEYATNHVKNLRHGFLGDTGIVDITGSVQTMGEIEIGDYFKSYYINGAPDTDDENAIRNWFVSGSTLPEGSYLTSSVLVGIFSAETYANEMTTITLEDSASFVLGGETRLLVYDETDNGVRYERVMDLTKGDAILAQNGNIKIDKIETTIFEEPQNVIALNLEDVDNFILDIDSIHGFSIGVYFAVAHNCFIAGTEITMEDGSVKNIENIVDGDVVLSFNENSLNVEPKSISNVRAFDETNFIKIKLENGKEIHSTLDHPYYTTTTKMKSYNGTTTGGEKLEIGDTLFLLNNEENGMVKIESITEYTDNKPVYIFTVEDNHNFYANGILVHNK
jgi:hypothetical protein